MRLLYVYFLGLFLALGFSFPVLATHQVGGQLEMQAIGDVAGHYRITITQYFEAGTPGADRQTSTGTMGIFRKRDNARMTAFMVNGTGDPQPLIFTNEFCAQQQNLNFLVLVFEATIQLDPAAYSDAQGYYMSYQTGNRNTGLTNISSPAQTGFTFYLEFPALQKNGQVVTNSSPRFSALNGEYICLGEPFTFAFGGTDPDGDELRYSMVTPLNRKERGQNPVSAGPYPDISWGAGFSATNAIPGSPTLTVNAQTGELSVTATQLGLYVFAVKIEEYRNGTKIGEVRRDFQFLVVDCPPSTTPDPDVQIVNRPNSRTTTLCQGESVLLQATVNSDWNYQWRRDGINLPGATAASLTVRDAGAYTVSVSPKTTCSKAGKSETITISVVGTKTTLSATGHLCATTGSVTLTTTGGSSGMSYQWYRDNQPLAGQTKLSVQTTQAGRYWAVLTYTALGCATHSDTTLLERSPAVQAVVQSTTSQNRICPQESLLLQSSGGIQYVWQKDGRALANTTDPQLRVNDAGIYVVTVVDADGCTGTSEPLTITQLSAPTVTLDSIPSVCGPNSPSYPLKGSPSGGEYAGPGVTGPEFSPKLAGVGNHALTYTVKAAPECIGTVATQTAVVAPIPTIQLADSMTTYQGNTFTLNPVYTGNPVQFRWVSATYLDDDRAANPTITAIADDITYTIDVMNSAGCAAKDTIHITVYTRVWIPDAFSPNGDGMNDVWALPGIEAFPDAIVTIFNRWGEVIYSSGKGYTHPFDGTRNGTALPSGIYAYTLSTVRDRPVIRGRLMLIR